MATRRKRITYSPTAERRAVLYARYSSSLQADSWSIEAQVADLRVYCERMGWVVLPEICIDEAISGSTDVRPGLERAMSLIRAGKANVLVVHKLDRFFRNMAKTFEYVANLEEYGAGLVCTQQPIDTTNPVSGKIVLAVMAAMAEIYLDNLSEETSKGMRARAAAGLPNGLLPYGYVLSKPAEVRGANNRAVALVVPEEAEAVRCAFDLYLTGLYGDAKIARTLNERGYRIRSRWQPAGGPFTKDTIKPMLCNPFYAGWVVQPVPEASHSYVQRMGGAPRVRGQHEPIISQELFDRAQAMRVGRRGEDARGIGHRGAVRQQRHSDYTAAGIVRCRVCGKRLRAQGAEGRKAHYRCNYAQRGGACSTHRKSLDASFVDGALAAAVGALRLPEGWRATALKGLDTVAAATARIETQRATLDRKLTRLRKLLIDGLIEEPEYRTERSAVEAELAGLSLPPEQVNLERAAALVADLGALWEAANPAERKELAGQVVEAMYCDPDHPEDVYVLLKPALHPLAAALPKCSTRVTDGA